MQKRVLESVLFGEMDRDAPNVVGEEEESQPMTPQQTFAREIDWMPSMMVGNTLQPPPPPLTFPLDYNSGYTGYHQQLNHTIASELLEPVAMEAVEQQAQEARVVSLQGEAAVSSPPSQSGKKRQTRQYVDIVLKPFDDGESNEGTCFLLPIHPGIQNSTRVPFLLIIPLYFH